MKLSVAFSFLVVFTAANQHFFAGAQLVAMGPFDKGSSATSTTDLEKDDEKKATSNIQIEIHGFTRVPTAKDLECVASTLVRAYNNVNQKAKNDWVMDDFQINSMDVVPEEDDNGDSLSSSVGWKTLWKGVGSGTGKETCNLCGRDDDDDYYYDTNLLPLVVPDAEGGAAAGGGGVGLLVGSNGRGESDYYVGMPPPWANKKGIVDNWCDDTCSFCEGLLVASAQCVLSIDIVKENKKETMQIRAIDDEGNEDESTTSIQKQAHIVQKLRGVIPEDMTVTAALEKDDDKKATSDIEFELHGFTRVPTAKDLECVASSLVRTYNDVNKKAKNDWVMNDFQIKYIDVVPDEDDKQNDSLSSSVGWKTLWKGVGSGTGKETCNLCGRDDDDDYYYDTNLPLVIPDAGSAAGGDGTVGLLVGGNGPGESDYYGGMPPPWANKKRIEDNFCDDACLTCDGLFTTPECNIVIGEWKEKQETLQEVSPPSFRAIDEDNEDESTSIQNQAHIMQKLRGVIPEETTVTAALEKDDDKKATSNIQFELHGLTEVPSAKDIECAASSLVRAYNNINKKAKNDWVMNDFKIKSMEVVPDEDNNDSLSSSVGWNFWKGVGTGVGDETCRLCGRDDDDDYYSDNLPLVDPYAADAAVGLLGSSGESQFYVGSPPAWAQKKDIEDDFCEILSGCFAVLRCSISVDEVVGGVLDDPKQNLRGGGAIAAMEG